MPFREYKPNLRHLLTNMHCSTNIYIFNYRLAVKTILLFTQKVFLLTVRYFEINPTATEIE